MIGSRIAATVWAGRAISLLVVLALLADAAINLLPPASLRAEMDAIGFSADLAPLLGVTLLVCTILYALPSTMVLGAILVTGFLGGAICAHFRLGEVGSPPQLASLLLGILTWGGLYLRDARLRGLLPLTS
jgi:DoxX-like family